METEERLDETNAEPEVSHVAHRRAGFVSGLMVGILVGAGFALLFAPEPLQIRRTIHEERSTKDRSRITNANLPPPTSNRTRECATAGL